MIILLLLIAILLILAIGGMFVMSILGSCSGPQATEEARVRAQVREADWRLHRMANDAFQAMLNETRRHRER